MIEQAIAKINEEMQKDPSNSYLEIIGQHVIDQCGNENVANAVMNEKKTLAGAMKEVMTVAKTKTHGNYAVLTDDEVFEIVEKYFKIEKQETKRFDYRKY